MTNDDSTIILVTGANKGIGLAASRRLAGRGATVLLGSRDRERGARAAASLPGLPVVPLDLDVTDDTSVKEAAARVEAEYGRLDVLVNNAGVSEPVATAAETSVEVLHALYEVNVFGPVRVTHAFLPLLERAAAPRVVMVSSSLGSNVRIAGEHPDGDADVARRVGLAYPSSKAALNMIAGQYARGLPWLRVDAVCPGWTATDLNGHAGTQTVEEGSDAIVATALRTDGPTARFLDRDGLVPW